MSKGSQKGLCATLLFREGTISNLKKNNENLSNLKIKLETDLDLLNVESSFIPVIIHLYF